ncbi:hypothetical protein [Aeromicrobium flavum]|uniref:hypothetical protein n=1 Tax=Aeromicrobium flavum TaxID=416568 RepID=UPI0031D03432
MSSGPTPEIWCLDHPEHGLLEVAVGTPADLVTVDPGFPIGAKSSGPGATRGFVLRRDGALVARYRQTKDTKVSIFKDPPGDSTFSANDIVVRRPRVAMTIAAFGDAVRHVTFRDRREVVHFDPPSGSSAEARLTAIEASPWKRVVYPIADGLGKASWAIFILVVVPVMMRLLDRLWPDVDVPLPDVDPPTVPLPDLPDPEIEISLPSIPWPDIDLPARVEFLMEWTKVWVPIVLGIALAVAAVRHSRTSRRTRQRWEADRAAREASADGD